jgi:hypothetical protein
MSTPNVHLDIRHLPLAALRPAPYNPRKILQPTDKAYQKLEASLRTFGLVEPLVWNENTGHVVGGHARLRILHTLGVTEVPVSVVRLSDAHEKALNIVLNNHEAQGRFDATKLADVLTELEPLPELPLTGFDATMRRNLELAPLPELAPFEPPCDSVTVTLEIPTATFAQVEPSLNELVRTFGLISHVQRT